MVIANRSLTETRIPSSEAGISVQDVAQLRTWNAEGDATGYKVDVDEPFPLGRKDHAQREPVASQHVNRRHRSTAEELDQFLRRSQTPPGTNYPMRYITVNLSAPANQAVAVMTAGNQFALCRYEATHLERKRVTTAQHHGEHRWVTVHRTRT